MKNLQAPLTRATAPSTFFRSGGADGLQPLHRQRIDAARRRAFAGDCRLVWRQRHHGSRRRGTDALRQHHEPVHDRNSPGPLLHQWHQSGQRQCQRAPGAGSHSFSDVSGLAASVITLGNAGATASPQTVYAGAVTAAQAGMQIHHDSRWIITGDSTLNSLGANNAILGFDDKNATRQTFLTQAGSGSMPPLDPPQAGSPKSPMPWRPTPLPHLTACLPFASTQTAAHMTG